MKAEKHTFFCLNCGKESIPLSRMSGKTREKFHKKKLYCPWCQMEINHIECRNEIEIRQFKEDYKNGVYDNDKKETLLYCGYTGVGEKHIH